MALHIVRTEREEPLTPAVERALRAGIGAGGRATLLLPTFSCALSAQRELASMPGLGVGVEALPYACLLYLIPLCYLFTKRFFFPAKSKGSETPV